MTQCIGKKIEFQGTGRRRLVADFDAGRVTSDAGGLLLREVEQRGGVIRRLATCFTDHRDPTRIDHTVTELLAQRIFALALGYEDLNDHEQLRCDPVLASLVGKVDVQGKDRRRARDAGSPLASPSTLNRLELTPETIDRDERYKKLTHDAKAIERMFVELFLEHYGEHPEELILDFDATDDPVHGAQEGRFFHGYYGHYCYLPLYVFCGRDLLLAQLRPSNIDGSAGTLEVLQWMVPMIRERWPEVRLIVRADSGFAREPIMRFCEEHGVHFIFGLARNKRLQGIVEDDFSVAKRQFEQTARKVKWFTEFAYQTVDTWSRQRRVIAKIEVLEKGSNPRFVVTSLGTEEIAARELYERMYCMRGEMENRIKEKQLQLFADRTSSSKFRANQLRLWISSAAYVLFNLLRKWGLSVTELANAEVGTIRLKLLKIGALVRVSVRRVVISMSSAFAYESIFRRVVANLRAGET